jgi:uncharacterized protein (TIGR02246 family)
MKRTIRKAFLVGVTVVSITNIFAANQADDENAIRALEARQPEAWNKHDAKAYASLFTENGDCVNVVGWWWKGRAEIEKKLTDAYVYVFKESALTITNVDIRFLTAEVAVAHVQWTMTGREDSSRNSSAAARTSNSRATKTEWPVADCSFTKYKLSSGDAIPERASRTATRREADAVGRKS